MDQIEEYNPPPNPTKLGDSRTEGYIREYGEECWELDALEPDVVTGLIQEKVKELRSQKLWNEARFEEEKHKNNLKLRAQKWPQVAEFVNA